MADFMRLLVDICSELRYFSNRKSHPSGVRAPITNTAIVTSTGRLKAKTLRSVMVWSESWTVNVWSLTSCCHQSLSTVWRARWLWSRRECSSWHKRRAAGNSSTLSLIQNQSRTTPGDQSGHGTNLRCSPEKHRRPFYQFMSTVRYTYWTCINCISLYQFIKFFLLTFIWFSSTVMSLFSISL